MANNRGKPKARHVLRRAAGVTAATENDLCVRRRDFFSAAHVEKRAKVRKNRGQVPLQRAVALCELQQLSHLCTFCQKGGITNPGAYAAAIVLLPPNRLRTSEEKMEHPGRANDLGARGESTNAWRASSPLSPRYSAAGEGLGVGARPLGGVSITPRSCDTKTHLQNLCP